MFTNASCTLFRKGVDTKTRLPTWGAVNIEAVYWEEGIGQTSISNQSGDHGMKQKNSVFIIIPKAYLPDQLPQKGDLIAYGINADQRDAHTIMNVEDFLYGSESVQHIEVTAV